MKKIVIIGSGVSGLYTALVLTDVLPTCSITLFTKATLRDSSTNKAQGGIAVAWDQNDSIASHVRDTLSAGAGLCDKKAVRILATEGRLCIQDLIDRGMHFDAVNGNLLLGREAAHSHNRIVHAGGDATGESLQSFLLKEVHRRERSITIQEFSEVFKLCQNDEGGFICFSFHHHTEKIFTTLADTVVLATGGCGQVYERTTNPHISSGDGLYLAHHLGIHPRNMEFYQFHPTGLYRDAKNSEDQDIALLSEAVRGEGALLRNVKGKAFMSRYDNRGELAPRDIVARAIWNEMIRTKKRYVYLDMTSLGKRIIQERFPTIHRMCTEYGLNPVTDYIPVAPVAHYQIGGIPVDYHGETSYQGLYAVGEVAYTGVHGANRLASNSLLEALVFGRRVAERIASNSTKKDRKKTTCTFSHHEQLLKSSHSNNVFVEISALKDSAYRQYADESLQSHPPFFSLFNDNSKEQLCELERKIRKSMWRRVGVLRKEEGLQKQKAYLEALRRKYNKVLENENPFSFRALSLLYVAEVMTSQALKRKKSIGAHCIVTK